MPRKALHPIAAGTSKAAQGQVSMPPPGDISTSPPDLWSTLQAFSWTCVLHAIIIFLRQELDRKPSQAVCLEAGLEGQ